MDAIRQYIGFGVIASIMAIFAVGCGETSQSPVLGPNRLPAPAPAKPAPNFVPPPGVNVKMVVPDLREQYGDYPAQPDGGSPNESGMGYFDQLLVHDGVNPLSPFVAESFAFNSDGDELTLNIRKGIKFNTPDVFAGSDYGELTAHDVVWNMNRQNTRSNPDFKPGLDEELGDTFGIAVAFDDYTVKVPLVWPNFLFLPISEFAFGGVTVRLASKNAYETEGAEAVKLVPVGSGPFTIGEWRPDDRGTVHAIPSHWAETSQISSFTVFQVPDMVTRIAALQTMQADLSEIDFARIGELEGMGLKFMQTMTDADTMTLGTIWPGNLWTDLNARTGEALEPWKSSVYEKDYPWIGCPWADRCPYDDRNNPQGMSDMEQARLVRWALSMTIDRQGIVDVLQGGLGTPIYQELMGPRFPGWQPDRTVTKSLIDTNIEKYGGTDWVEYDIDSPIPDEEWPWTIPTDLDRAEELLDLAGFPRDSDGVRFEINLNKYRCETGSLCLEQADVVASGWEEVGVRTTVLTENYRTVVHLRMKDRIQAWPVVKNCDVETANYSFDWPPPRSDTTFTRLNWGCSFESKFLDYMLVNISGAWEKAEREKMHLDMVDYFYYWQLYSGIVQLPCGIAANPDTIESWNSRSVQSGFWSSPQHIVPKQ